MHESIWFFSIVYNAEVDFLDPKRKKAHHNRILIGYLLMAVAVAMATWLLLNSSFGYWVDPKTGDVIQNGTVFLDSRPSGSTVLLDGVPQNSKTASRLTLPGSRTYNVRLEQDGYRPWSRTFSLDGRSIERLVYPLLIPIKLTASEVQLYAASPGLTSQSHDYRRLLVQQPGQTYTFDLYDLNNPANAPAVITIPQTILSEPTKASTLAVVEWAGDNHHVLFNRSYDGNHEYIMFDTEIPANSLNINSGLGVTPSTISLRDKKYDQLYIYEANGGVLRSADTKSKTISGPILNDVISYDSFGPELILYSTRTAAQPGKTNFRIRENDKSSYLLKSIPDASLYQLAINEFDGTLYCVIGGDTSDGEFIFRNPLPALKGQTITPLLVSSVLRLKAPQFVSFSDNGAFISAQSGKDIVVFDIEGDRQFKLSLKHPVLNSDNIKWMDGYRFSFIDSGTSYVIDFDGSNEQKLMPASIASGPYFSPDFKAVFSFAPSVSVPGRFAFTQTSLIKK